MNRRSNNNDSRIFYQWLDYAFEDYLAARLLRDKRECDKLCLFHCHQCIEKALKSFLLFHSGRLTDGHNLTFLCRQACGLDARFEQWLDESALLNKCYIQTRYPSDIPYEVDQYQLKAAFEMADRMFRFICRELEAEYLDVR